VRGGIGGSAALAAAGQASRHTVLGAHGLWPTGSGQGQQELLRVRHTDAGSGAAHRQMCKATGPPWCALELLVIWQLDPVLVGGGSVLHHGVRVCNKRRCASGGAGARAHLPAKCCARCTRCTRCTRCQRQRSAPSAAAALAAAQTPAVRSGAGWRRGACGSWMKRGGGALQHLATFHTVLLSVRARGSSACALPPCRACGPCTVHAGRTAMAVPPLVHMQAGTCTALAVPPLLHLQAGTCTALAVPPLLHMQAGTCTALAIPPLVHMQARACTVVAVPPLVLMQGGTCNAMAVP